MAHTLKVAGIVLLVVLILFGITGSWYGIGQFLGDLVTGFIDIIQGFSDGVSEG